MKGLKKILRSISGNCVGKKKYSNIISETIPTQVNWLTLEVGKCYKLMGWTARTIEDKWVDNKYVLHNLGELMTINNQTINESEKEGREIDRDVLYTIL